MTLSELKEETKILLLEGIHPAAEVRWNELGYSQVIRKPNALDKEELIELLQEVHVLGIRSRTQLCAETLAAASRLMAVGCFCIGTNQVDREQAAQLGIPVFNAPHSNTRSVAELIIGLTIMLFRGIFPKSQASHKGHWAKSAKGSHEVRGKTLGIIGYGHIGSQVSVLAEALGMRVLYYDTVSKQPLGNAQAVDSLRDLLRLSDSVSLHVPSTPLTREMINEEALTSMREGSFLINASRGDVVDIPALKEALESGYIAGAAIDVFPEEPKGDSHALNTPLRGMEQVILTPHIGGSTEEAQEHIAKEVSQKLALFLERGSTEGATNFPQLNLPRQESSHRILHIHHNQPGVIQQVNKVVAEDQINISSQYLKAEGDIGYVVFDIDVGAPEELQARLKKIEGTIRSRVLY